MNPPPARGRAGMDNGKQVAPPGGAVILCSEGLVRPALLLPPMFIPSSSIPSPDADPPSVNNQPPDPDRFDLEVDFMQMVSPPRRVHAPGQSAPPPAGEPAPAQGVPPERKPGEGSRTFGRFVGRPGAPMHPAGGPVTDPSYSAKLPAPRTAGAPFRGREDLGYAANRLQSVMKEACQHSSIDWLDHVGKAQPILLSLLIAGILAGLGWSFRNELRRGQGGETIPAPPSPGLLSDGARKAAIRRAFDRFLAAPDVTGKLPWVLEPSRVEARMKDYYLTRSEQDPQVASYEVSPPLRAAGAWWFTLACKTPEGAISTVLMKETASGGQLDWENFVAYGSMPWEKFLALRPDVPQSIRAKIRSSSEYHGKYTAGQYVAFEIAHRSSLAVLQAYAARFSRTGQLLAALSPGETWQPANLYLRCEPDAGTADSVVIVDLIRNNWLDAGVSAAAGTPSGSEPSLR